MHRRNYTEITEEDMQSTIEKEKVDFDYDIIEHKCFRLFQQNTE